MQVLLFVEQFGFEILATYLAAMFGLMWWLLR